MRLHSITKFIDTLDSSIGSSVKANAVVCAADVVIDCTRYANHVNAILAQSTSTTKRAITADGNNAVQSKEFTGRDSLPLAFLSHKFLASCGI